MCAFNCLYELLLKHILKGRIGIESKPFFFISLFINIWDDSFHAIQLKGHFYSVLALFNHIYSHYSTFAFDGACRMYTVISYQLKFCTVHSILHNSSLDVFETHTINQIFIPICAIFGLSQRVGKQIKKLRWWRNYSSNK